jgi:hypothetical protein
MLLIPKRDCCSFPCYKQCPKKSHLSIYFLPCLSINGSGMHGEMTSSWATCGKWKVVKLSAHLLIWVMSSKKSPDQVWMMNTRGCCNRGTGTSTVWLKRDPKLGPSTSHRCTSEVRLPPMRPAAAGIGFVPQQPRFRAGSKGASLHRQCLLAWHALQDPTQSRPRNTYINMLLGDAVRHLGTAGLKDSWCDVGPCYLLHMCVAENRYEEGDSEGTRGNIVWQFTWRRSRLSAGDGKQQEGS